MLHPSRKPSRTGFVRLALVAGAGLFLAGCEVTVTEPGPYPPDRPQYCPRIYEPVCASRGDRERTFPNACEARADGWRVRHRGECRRGPDRPEVCPMIYQPVCGRDGDQIRRYSNECEMRRDGAVRVPDRFCRRG